MASEETGDSADGYTPPQTDLPTAPTKSWRLMADWWFLMVFALIAISVVVSFFDQAGSRIAIVLSTLLSLFALGIRNFWRPNVAPQWKALPILLLIGGLAVAFAAIRIDEMDGNLIPQRVSWSWEPNPDERLSKLEPKQIADGIDLVTTTDADFPQFLGPNRDGVIDVQLNPDWDANPPTLVWKKEEFGAGHAGFAAVNGYAVTLEQRGEEECVTCYEIESGDLVWSHAMPTRHDTPPGGVGPRSTPAIHDGRVYTMGANGDLVCLDGANGSVIWQKNLLDEIGTTPEAEFDKIQWGRAASPLIDNGRLIIPLGLKDSEDEEEKGATLIAFDAVSGEELWRNGKHQISYASPQIATLGGVRQFVQVCGSQVCGFDIDTGDQLWEYPWPGNSAANASCSQAIQIDAERLLLSKAYAHGASLIRVTKSDGGWKTEKIWHTRQMKTKFTNAVIHDGFIYGLDDSILACVDLETGKRKWKRGRYGHGQILKAGSHLLVQIEKGDVALVAFDPSMFREIARFSPIEGRTWNNPCLFGKTLLVRNGQQAACYRLP